MIGVVLARVGLPEIMVPVSDQHRLCARFCDYDGSPLDLMRMGEWLRELMTMCEQVRWWTKPRLSPGFLAARTAFGHLHTAAAAQAPPNVAPDLFTRPPPSKSPFKTLKSDQTSVFSTTALMRHHLRQALPSA